MKRENGFTLIELLIVMAIIVVIAAIAIPSLTTNRGVANESSAIASIRTIQTAQAAYQASYPSQGYAGSLAVLGGPDSCKPSATTACLIDEVLSSGLKAGYNLAVTGGDPGNGANTTYVVGAAPVAYNHTGIRRFCSTEKNVIRWDLNTEGSTNPPTAEECAQFQPLR